MSGHITCYGGTKCPIPADSRLRMDNMTFCPKHAIKRARTETAAAAAKIDRMATLIDYAKVAMHAEPIN